MICPNCGYEHTEEDKYCPRCGQKTRIGRITWKWIATTFAKAWIGSDRGIIFTIKELFSRPGKMMLDYVSGKRIRYFNPFQLLALIAAVYTIIKSFADKAKEVSANTNASLNVNDFSIDSSAWDTLENVFDYISEHPLMIWIAALPLLTISLRWVLGKKFRKEYFWSESFFISTFVVCQYFLLRIVIDSIDLLIPSYDLADSFWNFALVIALFTWDICQLGGKKIVDGILCAILGFIIFYGLIVVIAIVAIVIGAVIVAVFSGGFNNIDLGNITLHHATDSTGTDSLSVGKILHLIDSIKVE